MKLIEKKVKVVELEPEETTLLIELLNYCYHRAEKHESPISRFADEIKEFRKQLKII